MQLSKKNTYMSEQEILVLSRSQLKEVVREILFEREKEMFYHRIFTYDEVCKMLNINRLQLRYLIKKGKLVRIQRGQISGVSVFNLIKEFESK